MKTDDKLYLGDGAYVAGSDYALVITAEDGLKATDTVHLEPDAMRKLFKYACYKWGPQIFRLALSEIKLEQRHDQAPTL